jgi:hypothetical protein
MHHEPKAISSCYWRRLNSKYQNDKVNNILRERVSRNVWIERNNELNEKQEIYIFYINGAFHAYMK